MSEKLSREEEVAYGDISIEKINSEKTQRHLNQIEGVAKEKDKRIISKK